MALELISTVSATNLVAPTQLHPIVNPQSSSSGVKTLQNDPDSVVITLSESQNAANDRNSGSSAGAREEVSFSPKILEGVLASNLSVRLAYDAPLSRSFLEIVNRSTERVIFRIPSKNFVSFINQLLDR